jgi:glycosyltransferase involved in cell wall biosynthesis
MLNNKIVAVVIPAYNEENQILQVLESMPAFVDRIIVIDDCSTDATAAVVLNFIIILILQSLRRRQNKRDIIEPIWFSMIW